ncbi:MAG: hypothetical protein Q8Q38_01330 [bacterium]|nr:hypothetical protein [bacterium]MDZ4232142.1 hypothetical protein [Candidatus Pacearchaeota archaeon]
MAQACAVCDKQKNRAWRRIKLRGKFNPTIKRTQKPNLQWFSITELAAKKTGLVPGERVKACTKCMKALGK